MANAPSFKMSEPDYPINVRIKGLTHLREDIYELSGVKSVGELPMEEMAKLMIDNGFSDIDARQLAERFMHEAWAHQLAKVLAERITPIY